MTLLETVVWIGLFTAAMFAIMQSVIYFYRTNNYVIQEASEVTSAQQGIDEVVKTFREASYAANGAYPIVSIAANDIVFYADVDSDALVERVHYYVSGSNLYRGILNPSGDPPNYTGTESITNLSEYVRNITLATSTFTFFDKNGAQITDYTRVIDVRFITAHLIVNIDPNKLPNQLSLKSSAALRNIR